MNILITGGGTQEKIDQVRSITNTSTGTTALGLARFLNDAGYHNIFYVHAKRNQNFEKAKQNFTFVSSQDLENQLKNILAANDIDVIIHAAAVSDFIVDKVVINGELYSPEYLSKISSLDEIELILKRRSKIIEKLKSFSKKPHPLVIGFKLTNTPEAEDQKNQILKLGMSENIDFVVHNDLQSITEVTHPTNIYFKDQLMFQGKTKIDLYKNIQRILELYTFNQENKEESRGTLS